MDTPIYSIWAHKPDAALVIKAKSPPPLNKVTIERQLVKKTDMRPLTIYENNLRHLHRGSSMPGDIKAVAIKQIIGDVTACYFEPINASDRAEMQKRGW